MKMLFCLAMLSACDVECESRVATTAAGVTDCKGAITHKEQTVEITVEGQCGEPAWLVLYLWREGHLAAPRQVVNTHCPFHTYWNIDVSSMPFTPSFEVTVIDGDLTKVGTDCEGL